jgi:hypothetical protein
MEQMMERLLVKMTANQAGITTNREEIRIKEATTVLPLGKWKNI